MTDRPRRVAPSALYLLACAAVLAPTSAHAHLVSTGLGPLYDGMVHVLLSVEDIVSIAALSILAGLSGPAAGRSALFALTPTWLAGGMLGYEIGAALLAYAGATISFIVLGGLTASGLRLSPGRMAALSAAMGVLHGWLNGAAFFTAGASRLSLLGVVSAVFVLVSLIAAGALALRSEPKRTVARVAGSWVAAVGLLMLGWALQGGS